MIDWVQTTETELNDSKYHVMNIGKLDNMGFNVDAETNKKRKCISITHW